MNLNLNMIKSMAANPAVFSRAQSFYNFGATIKYYIIYDKVDDYQVFAEVIEDPDLFHVHLNINEQGKVTHHMCDCGGFHTKFGSCKHVIALLLRLYDDQIKNRLVIHSGLSEDDDLISKVLDTYETNLTSELNYEMYPQQVTMYPKLVINSCNQPSLEVSMGITRPYVIRDLYRFVIDLECECIISYGKELEFKHTMNHFDERSRPLVKFIWDRVVEDRVYLKQFGLSPGQARQLFLTPSSLDTFYDLNLRKTIACSIEYYNCETITLHSKEPEIEFQIEEEDSTYYLRHNLGQYLIIRGQNYTYLLQEREMYRCHEEFVQNIIPLLEKMSEATSFGLKISNETMGKFLSLVLPKIKPYIRDTALEELYQKFKVYPLTFGFYLDSEFKGNIGLRVQYRYGDIHIDANQPNTEESKQILRDVVKEAKVLAMLETFHFEKIPGGTYLLKDEEATYTFLTEGINELRQIGEVYASETFKGIKIKEPKSLSVGIRLQSEWLNVHFEDLEFDASEYKKILAAYRLNKKYFRLKDGSFINLQNDYVETLASFVDDLNLKDNEFGQAEVMIPKYRALYLDQLIQHHETLHAVRDASFKSMVREFKLVEDADFIVPEPLQKTLRRYQKTGFRWIKTLAKYQMGGILADDMGLGKTLQIISVLLSEQSESTKPSLIVAPSSLIYNWKSEIEKFAPSLNVLIVTGEPTVRQDLINTSTDYDVVITSYDLIRRDIEVYETQQYRFCILDEAHFIKNHTTQNAKSVKRIRSEVHFALTGTPIENSLADLWSIFDFILPGYFGSYSQFKKKYEAPIVKHHHLHLLTRIHQQVAPFILRRLKKDVLKELPDKIETNVYCEMGKTQRDLYYAMLSQMKQEMHHEIEEVGVERSRIKILALLMRLRQLCCHPSLYLENYRGESAKLNLCMQLVQDCIASGHKVLIFSQFTSMLEILGRELKAKEIKFLTLTGATKTSDRLALTEQFNQDDTKVFLISLKAGGTGLNLTGADVVIHYDPWWNMSAQNQATDRAHRLGQDKTVQVFKLMVKNTIEERIQVLQEQKRDLTEAIVKEGETFISKLSTEELSALFEEHHDF
ncbi:DEAD/DEAH box helicase [Turicibacter sanguinis]|nr:DEAD/DEAH box helicase [Turicibacter sanguinis]